MKLALRYRPAAAKEMEVAFRWYEKQRAGLGREFVAAIDDILQKIANGPEHYPIVFRDARQAIVKRFPYAVHFTTRGDYVEILSVFHSSRNPRIWQRRVK